jgi:hypothetical protein
MVNKASRTAEYSAVQYQGAAARHPAKRSVAVLDGHLRLRPSQSLACRPRRPSDAANTRALPTDTMADMEILDGVSAEQLFRGEDSNGLTFDDIIAMVRPAPCCFWCTARV